MNYYEIGQRIRKFRKAYNLSQEQLAEMVQISTTHMSHIETGNTKLSLPVLVDIAEALSVQTDELLYDNPPYNKTGMKQEINELLDSCSTRETRILLDILKSVRESLSQNMNTKWKIWKNKHSKKECSTHGNIPFFNYIIYFSSFVNSLLSVSNVCSSSLWLADPFSNHHATPAANTTTATTTTIMTVSNMKFSS